MGEHPFVYCRTPRDPSFLLGRSSTSLLGRASVKQKTSRKENNDYMRR
jgi:hypothetical protein